MSADPRAALSTLTAALERHLEVASARRDPDDPGVVAAAQRVVEAFDDYDDCLFRATEVATPLAVYEGQYDDDDLDDEDDTGVYAGLDDEEIDFDEDEDEDDDSDDEDDDLDDDLDDDDDDTDDDDTDDEDDDDPPASGPPRS